MLFRRFGNGTVWNGLKMLRTDIPYKTYEYRGFFIYKYFENTYILYDENIQQIIIITKTLKEMKERIDRWKNKKAEEI